MKKLVLWLALLWSIAMLLFGLLVLGLGADLEGIALRQDVRDLIAAAPNSVEMLAFYDGRWMLLNRTAAFLAGTGLALLIVSIIGLRATRTAQNTGA